MRPARTVSSSGTLDVMDTSCQVVHEYEHCLHELCSKTFLLWRWGKRNELVEEGWKGRRVDVDAICFFFLVFVFLHSSSFFFHASVGAKIK